MAEKDRETLAFGERRDSGTHGRVPLRFVSRGQTRRTLPIPSNLALRSASESKRFVDHDPPHPRLERRLVLEARPLPDRLRERLLHRVFACAFVPGNRRGRTDEARQVGSVK